MSIPRNHKLPAKHPGEVLLQTMKLHNISIGEAAKQINISELLLNRFLEGKTQVSVDLAVGLEKVTNISSGFWINLQNNYDLYANKHFSNL